MNILGLARKSAAYFWRTNLAIALGVAAAVAVLVGALLVGQSMRGSLRAIALDRLGRINDILAADHFFREDLAQELLAPDGLGAEYSIAIPVLMLPQSAAESIQGGPNGEVRRASDVTVYGVPDSFWSLQSGPGWSLKSEHALINEQLAAELGIPGQADSASLPSRITIRLGNRQQLSSDSALGKKDGLVQSLPDVPVAGVVPNRELGHFGLHPTQLAPRNVFVSLAWLQQSLGDQLFKGKSDFRQVNALFLVRHPGVAWRGTEKVDWSERLRPTLEDLGLRATHVVRGHRDSEEAEFKLAFEYISLSCDGLVFRDDAARIIQTEIPQARPSFTYLANRIQLVRAGKPMGEAVPFSMVSGVSSDDVLRLESPAGQPLGPLDDGVIGLNEWAASDLNAEVGDTIRLAYFEPEAPGGNEVERTVDLKLGGIARLTKPAKPYSRRGRQWTEAQFAMPPTAANDPELTPLVPGLTDAESIESWSLPFETPGIRRVDDEYWQYYRTTPKAFVALSEAQRLWNSRFGQVTTFRIPVDESADEALADVATALQSHADAFGFNMVAVRENGLRAAGGATPFDFLFLALSSFVMLAALILILLLVRLAMQQRADQLGLMSAAGFRFARLAGVWLWEMLAVCLLGALVGIGLGWGYAALMLHGLNTWWVGAIRTPFVRLHASPGILAIGAAIGLAMGLLTIAWTLWRARRVATVKLLQGRLDGDARSDVARGRGWTIAGRLSGLGAIPLVFAATRTGGDAQAGLFFGAGFCWLVCLLLEVRRWLFRTADFNSSNLRLATLAVLNARRHPQRTGLAIGLVAVASFLIAAISAFRVAPDEAGTGGFDLVATASQPLFADLGTVEGRQAALLEPARIPVETEVLSFRLKSGDDASCTNPYQVSQPRVLGLPPAALAALSDPRHSPFAWSGVERAFVKNPWQVLSQAAALGEPIPAVIDKNTAWYSLKVFRIGDTFDVRYDSGEQVTFRLAGLLNNTILQGSVLVSERDFVRAFPNEPGSRYFLVRTRAGSAAQVLSRFESDLADQGFDGRNARDVLADLLAVQNTYLSTFQALGGLGLLLGTFGLAAVQLRSVLERRRELALLRAVGFRDPQLVKLVIWENFLLLAVGLVVGIAAAGLTVLPHYLFGNATIPWGMLSGVFAIVLAAGWLSVVVSARRVLSIPLLTALREP
jgi:ABC-type antimicrobial peptide transport system permease subunit